MSSTWYLGPYGDLRALECPEMNLTAPVVRYGGVHQGLSGARTVDITGFKQEYNLELKWLSATQMDWLNAVFTRLVPGPLHLISPLKKNRMSAASSAAQLALGRAPGLSISGGLATRVMDYPTGILGAVSFQNAGYGASNFIRFDSSRHIPVFTSEQVTFSVYLRVASGTQATTLVLDSFRKDGTQTTSPSVPITVTSTWQRFTITTTMAADAVNTAPALVFNLGGAYPSMRIAAPQLEAAPSATAWQAGPGATRVVIDQMPVTSPRLDYYHVSLSLLEA